MLIPTTIEATVTLHELADIGIILLLFSIGLKVKVRKLLDPQIWAVASLHMAIMVVLMGAAVFCLGLVGFMQFEFLFQ